MLCRLLQVSVLRFRPRRLPRDRACRMHCNTEEPGWQLPAFFDAHDIRIGPPCGHACRALRQHAPQSSRHKNRRYQAARYPPNSPDRALPQVTTLFRLPGSTQPSKSAPPAQPSSSTHPAQPVVRWAIPVANRSTMSENTTSVSTSSMTPVISSSTKPCNAAQNSNAA